MKHLFDRIFLFGVLLLALAAIQSCSSSEDSDSKDPLPALEITDLSYGTGVNQTLDIFLPEGRNLQETPLLIYIHGGGWTSGDKSEFYQFKPLMEQELTDYAFASINYRLYDTENKTNPFPAQADDVRSAIELILSKSQEWNIDGQIVLAGASAGAHLALLHGYKLKMIGDIQYIIAFFPPTDLAELYKFNTQTALGLTEFIGGTPDTHPFLYEQASPVKFIGDTSPPTIFFHGTDDQVVPYSQALLLEDALNNNVVDHEFYPIQNQGHGFDILTYSQCIQQAIQFIK
ncbi:alpha/beta hydrolase [Algoriphagus vanfongensis]|uniref:alpha/beta hydrolase n=1 Tax=Algoriphagus vanfongensis TaxID=426371 RepID=UPI00040B74F8|nr:alpha/beta hydrolase [Algoriphagus vanfongensis]